MEAVVKGTGRDRPLGSQRPVSGCGASDLVGMLRNAFGNVIVNLVQQSRP